LNDEQIILNVTAVEEEEIDEDIEDSGVDLKSLTSHSEGEAMLSKCIDWFEVKKNQMLRKSYLHVKYVILLLKKLENQKTN